MASSQDQYKKSFDTNWIVASKETSPASTINLPPQTSDADPSTQCEDTNNVAAQQPTHLHLEPIEETKTQPDGQSNAQIVPYKSNYSAEWSVKQDPNPQTVPAGDDVPQPTAVPHHHGPASTASQVGTSASDRSFRSRLAKGVRKVLHRKQRSSLASPLDPQILRSPAPLAADLKPSDSQTAQLETRFFPLAPNNGEEKLPLDSRRKPFSTHPRNAATTETSPTYTTTHQTRTMTRETDDSTTRVTQGSSSSHAFSDAPARAPANGSSYSAGSYDARRLR